MTWERVEITAWDIHAEEDGDHVSHVVELSCVIIEDLFDDQFGSVPEPQGEHWGVAEEGSDPPNDGHFSLKRNGDILVIL